MRKLILYTIKKALKSFELNGNYEKKNYIKCWLILERFS